MVTHEEVHNAGHMAVVAKGVVGRYSTSEAGVPHYEVSLVEPLVHQCTAGVSQVVSGQLAEACVKVATYDSVIVQRERIEYRLDFLNRLLMDKGLNV